MYSNYSYGLPSGYDDEIVNKLSKINKLADEDSVTSSTDPISSNHLEPKRSK